MGKIGVIISNEEKKAGAHVGYICYVPEFSSFIYSKRTKFLDIAKYKSDLLCELPEGVTQSTIGYFTETTNMKKIKEKISNEENELFKLSNISHNFSVFKHGNKYYGLGGSHFYCNTLDKETLTSLVGIGAFRKKKYNGLYLLTSEDCIHWSEPKLIFDQGLSFNRFGGFHSSYDSQACIFYNNNDKNFYMYHRYNPTAGIRKLALLKSKTINDWSKSEWTVVKTEGDLNFYTGYIFMKNNKFYGIVNYYKPNMINTKVKYSSFNIGLIESLDGINFKLKKTYIEKCEFFPVMNSLQEINDKSFVYLWNKKGEIGRVEIDLN